MSETTPKGLRNERIPRSPHVDPEECYCENGLVCEVCLEELLEDAREKAYQEGQLDTGNYFND